MAVGRLLILPSSLVLALYFNNLLAFVSEQAAGLEGGVRARHGMPGRLVQVDGFTSPIAADGRQSPEGKVRSPVLEPHPLTFDPPSLDFREQSVGMPSLEVVRVLNPSKSQTLQLTSISGDSSDFHPSFFKSKVVKPGDWTTFDVVFLARFVGAVQNTLYIHTSLGTFDYKVQGVGVANPFRVRSLLGARIPLNATYSPLITMYNPFNSSLQITEMYSSGGELHLELLTGQSQGSRSLWEIRPYETKPIARANFFGRVPINYTSFIRIKTNHPLRPSIVLPIEVEVSENTGLFLSREFLDFGIVKSGESKALPIFVLNAGPHQVHIRSISVQPENPALEVQYTTTMLKPGSKYLRIALVTFYADRVTSTAQHSGKLIIRAEDKATHQLVVPYEVSMLHGSLSYEKSQTMFRVGKPPFHPVIRNISLSNQFDVPLVLYDVRVAARAQEYFAVQHVLSPYVLPPSSEWHQPFSVRFHATSSDCLFNTTLRLSTNASFFNIPLHCYDGRVQYFLENLDDDVLDYGILSEADHASKTFALYNPNPIRITIMNFMVSDHLPHTTMELQYLQPHSHGRESSSSGRKKVPNKPPYQVDAGYDAVFRVNISHPKTLGTFTGEILIYTSFDRVLHVPVYYKTAVGSIKTLPETLVLDPAFPYAISKMPLLARSYYPQPVSVVEVYPDPPDQRVYVINERIHKFPPLRPNALVEVGTLFFDPMKGGGGKGGGYIGVSGEGWKGAAVTEGRLMDPGWDVDQFQAQWRVWESLVEQKHNMLNFSLILKTNLGTEVTVPARTSLHWPPLTSSHTLQFPLTIVGNSSVQMLELSNPSDRPLLVQPLLLHQYTRPNSIVDLLSNSLDPELLSNDFTRSAPSFTFQTVGWGTDSPSATALLPPASDAHQITVVFTPKVDQPASSLLLIRNNLTILDYVLLQGRGSLGVFTIDGIRPGSEPLLFEFGSPLLDKCLAGLTFSEPLQLTRIFWMHNSGPSPLYLAGMEVGGGGCEEHGFSISSCGQQASLLPNRTRKIEISFTPDFTQSRVSNMLRVRILDGTEMLFPLLATLSHSMLAACYSVQPRPEWEKTLTWFSVPFWLSVLLLLVIVALVQTNFGIRSQFSHHVDNNELPIVQPSGGRVFDLADITRNIHATLNNRIAALRASIQPETLRPSERENEHTARVETHKAQKQHAASVSKLSLSTAPSESKVTHILPQQQSLHGQQQQQSEFRHRGAQAKHTTAPASLYQSSQVSQVATKSFSGGSSSGGNSKSGTALAVGSEDRQISVATDHETGMRGLPSVEGSLRDWQPVTVADSKTERPSKTSPKPLEAASLPTGSGLAATPDTTPSVTPLAARKTKGTRKMGTKLLKSPHVVETPSLIQNTVRSDQLERKESESSIRSTDSDSTTSSTDKSEEKDDLTTASSSGASITVEIEVKHKAPPPLTKEPGTGQTIPITDSSEELQHMKNEASPEPTPLQSRKEKDLPVAAVSSKMKSKKKMKQQQKKEEKLRRREKEREREREKEKEKEREREREREQEEFAEVDKDSTASTNSMEALEEISSEQVATTPAESKNELSQLRKPKVDEKNLMSEKEASPEVGSSPTKSQKPLGSPVEVASAEHSPEPEPESPESVRATKPVKQAPEEDGNKSPGPPGDQPPAISHSVIPTAVDSVPSTAIRTTRVRISKQQQLEEILSDPFSRNPDRSSYTTKKSGSKKPPEKTEKVESKTKMENSHERMPPKGTDLQKEARNEGESVPPAIVIAETNSSPKTRPHFLTITESASAEPATEDSLATSPESGGVETDGPLSQSHHLAPSKSSQPLPTSPHELAALLLSNKLRKKSSEPEKESEGEEKPERRSAVEEDSSSFKSFQRPVRDRDRSPHKYMGHHQYRSPSNLSLDAEPFYPSPNFQHKLQARTMEPKRKYHPIPSEYLSAPPGFGPDEASMSYMGHYPPEKKIRRREHYRQHPKGLTPSPPYNTVSEGQHFSFMDHPGLEPQEAFGFGHLGGDPRLLESGRMDPSLLDVPEDPQTLLSLGRMGSRSGSRGLDPQLVAAQNRLRLAHTDPAYSDAYLASALQQQQQQQQQQQAVLAAQRRARGRSEAQFGSLWDQPHSYPLRSLSEDDEVLAQRQQLLRRQYLLNLYRQQARKSAETLSSLSQPYRHSRSSLFAPEPNQPSSNLWENPNYDPLVDPFPLSHNSSMDDAFLSESVHAHQLRQQLLLNREQAARQSHARRRTFSGESEIGGEIVSSLRSALQSPSSSSAIGPLNRAPGSAFSRGIDPPRGLPSRHEPPLDGSPWPPESSEPPSGSNWGSIWSLDSPFSSTSKDLGLGSSTTTNTTAPTSTRQPFVGSTYDLFDNQGIWSLSSSDNTSGLFSWAHAKPNPEKND